jgi:hypothetical protein
VLSLSLCLSLVTYHVQFYQLRDNRSSCLSAPYWPLPSSSQLHSLAHRRRQPQFRSPGQLIHQPPLAYRGRQATVGFTITSTGGQSSVALNLSTGPDGVSADAEASDADGGEFAQGGEEVAYVFPSGTLAPQLVFNISTNANDGEKFVVEYEVLNENSTAVSTGTITITATTALSVSATSLSVAGDAGNQMSAEFSITDTDGQQRVELDLSDVPSALTVNQQFRDGASGLKQRGLPTPVGRTTRVGRRGS